MTEQVDKTGNKGASSGKSSGGAGGSVTQTPRIFSEAENAFKNADTRKEIRTAVENLVGEMSPGDVFTTAVTQDFKNVGGGEVLKSSIRHFSINDNKNIVNVMSGKEYTSSEFTNALYKGTINITAIESGTLNSADFAKVRYGNKGSVK